MQNDVQKGFVGRPETAPRPSNPALDEYDSRFSKVPPEPRPSQPAP
jgi:hypothetical protein